MKDRNKMIMEYFPSSDSWEKNYKKIIELGKKLPRFNEEDKKDKFLIKACQSPLWLKAELNKQGEIILTGESEGLITKGLLALFIEFYTQQTPENILKIKPLFIEKLQLVDYLSARRTNGLQALLDQIQQYSKAFLIISQSTKA